jgi:tubby-related protein 1
VLNFKGRVAKPSTKNFQLIEENGKEIFLQFGKVSDTTYAMDCQYPLSPFQAFAICLTALEKN